MCVCVWCVVARGTRGGKGNFPPAAAISRRDHHVQQRSNSNLQYYEHANASSSIIEYSFTIIGWDFCPFAQCKGRQTRTVRFEAQQWVLGVGGMARGNVTLASHKRLGQQMHPNATTIVSQAL